MKNIICLLSICGVLLGCGASANPEVAADPETPIECAAMPNPPIKLSVYDSITNDVVSTARVKLYFKDVAQPQELAFNAEALLYTGILPRSSLLEVSILATEEKYHPAVVKAIPYIIRNNCMEPIPLEYKIYLCPLNSGCL